MKHRDIENGPFPLSSEQQSLWLVEQMRYDNEASNSLKLSIEFNGPLNYALLRKALDEVIRRHLVLRASFDESNGVPEQNIYSTGFDSLAFVDLNQSGSLSGNMQNEDLIKCLDDFDLQPFDLRSGLTWRMIVIALSKDKYVFSIHAHRIVCDSESLIILMKEVLSLYDALLSNNPPSLLPISITYLDFIDRQRSSIIGEDYYGKLRYWKSKLKGAPSLHSLPFDSPEDKQKNKQCNFLTYSLDADLANKLRTVSRLEGASLNITLLTSFIFFLAQRGNSTDWVLGVPLSERVDIEFAELIGCLSNLMPLRVKWSGDLSWSGLLDIVKKGIWEGIKNQGVPFANIVNEVSPERHVSHNPLAQIGFNYQKFNSLEQDFEKFSISGANEFYNAVGQASQFDLQLGVLEAPEGLSLYWGYKEELFSQSTIQQFQIGFERVLYEIWEYRAKPHSFRLIEPKQVEKQHLSENLSVDEEAEFIEPKSKVEAMLLSLWLEVLEIEKVSVNDNFFSLGGHSLKATQVMSRLHQLLGLDLGVRRLFEYPTIKSLALFIEKLTPQKDNKKPKLNVIHRPNRLPLSYAQQRLWFLDRLQEGCSTEYNMPDAWRMKGTLDLTALVQSFNALIARHETLRTRFVERNGEPEQVIIPELIIDIPVEDLCHLSGSEQQDVVELELEKQWQEGFDLATGPLIRARLLKLNAQDHLLLSNLHHIISDGWSRGVQSRDFSHYYNAYSQGKQPKIESLNVQYADFSLWQRQWLSEERLAEGLKYWQTQLAGIPKKIDLPTLPRPASQTYIARRHNSIIPAATIASLEQLGLSHQATLYMTLLSAFSVLMGRYSGQSDFTIGSPVANRQEPQLEDLIGFFVNSLVMRLKPEAEMTFIQLLESVKHTTMAAYQFQDVPFEQLVETINPERDLSTPPLFQVTFAVHNTPMTTPNIVGLDIQSEVSQALRVRFDLEVHVLEHQGCHELVWIYNQDLFDAQQISGMDEHFHQLLERVIDKPDSRLCDYNVLSTSQQVQWQKWSQGEVEPVADFTVVELFEQQVVARPESIAIVFEGGQLTYRELNQRANQLAHQLIALGVTVETLVGLCVERSVEMIIGLLAIVKAGGAYVPIDVSYPASRLRYLLEDSGVRLLLTQANLIESLPQLALLQYLDISLVLTQAEANTNTRNPVVAISGEQLAYVIYTSGSTGKPKGVMVTHQSLTHLLQTQSSMLDFTLNDQFLSITNIAFDISVIENLMPLIIGGAVLLVESSVTNDFSVLVEKIKCDKPSHIQATPVTWMSIYHKLVGMDWCKVIISTGEALNEELASALSQLAPVSYNLYGPTEATVWASGSQLQSTSVANSIGRPLANTQILILDPNGQPLPPGVAGELYIGGVGLARGYLNRPALTAERFVEVDVLGCKQRLYRSGDKARWSYDGELEFLGRFDDQVKLRGYRIELGEVETALREHTEVEDALVVLAGEGEDKHLSGYVIARQDEESQQLNGQSHIRHWQALYQQTYNSSAAPSEFDIVGWNSSYTGEAIAADEMRIWVNETVAQIRQFSSTRVLEIGCGTGLLLTRLAADVERYIGLDFSDAALARLGATIAERDDLAHVELHQGLAHELGFLETGCVDLVILNSVVQYFPDVEYLLEVIKQLCRVCTADANIFMGDIRNLKMLEAYHASVIAYRADENALLEWVSGRYRQALQDEEELLLAPEFFEELAQNWPGIARAEVRLKSGDYDNELSRFRFDVSLKLGGRQQLNDGIHWIDWDEADIWRETLRVKISADAGQAYGVRGLQDSRASEAVQLYEQIQQEQSDYLPLKDLYKTIERKGEDPNRLFELARLMDAELIFLELEATGGYQVVFNPCWVAAHEGPGQPGDYHRYVNRPAQRSQQVRLGAELKGLLQQQLPDYMVPSGIMVLSRFPLTANGKIDKHCLPEFVRTAARIKGEFVAPSSELELSLASIWQAVLMLSTLPGLNDDFFDLGGHSLLSANVVARIEKELGVKVPLKQFFEQPTISGLVKVLSEAEALKETADEPLSSEKAMPWCLPEDIDYRLKSYLGSWKGARSSEDGLIFGHNLNGTRPPIFWVFQGYQECSQLAKYLGDDQPLYGMRSGHLLMEYSEDDIQQLALRYVSEIEALYPEGAFYIGGNCQGGLIALCIAQHMQRRHRIVLLTFLIDWMFPAQSYTGQVSLLFGRESECNPYINYHNPELSWQRSFPNYRVDVFPGSHGRFFEEPNVQGLSTVIKRNIAETMQAPVSLLPPIERKAELVLTEEPKTLVAGTKHMISIRVRNTSTLAWQSSDCSGVTLNNCWLTMDNKPIEKLDGCCTLPALQPGESCLLLLPINVPFELGLIKFKVSLVEAGQGWFSGVSSGELEYAIEITQPINVLPKPLSDKVIKRGAPIIIGGSGGSGTRLVAKILSDAGIYLGEQTDSADSIGMVSNWSSELLPYWNHAIPEGVKASICEDLDRTLIKFFESSQSTTPIGQWGWKLPPHAFFATFFHQVWPNFRCVHVVRDGRDMALSKNQNQLGYLGPIVLSPRERLLPKTQQSLLLWERLNTNLATYAAQHLPGQYLCLRYEELCSNPEESIKRLFDFLDIKKQITPYLALVKASSGIGRWQEQSLEIKHQLLEVGQAGLSYFGYEGESAPVSQLDFMDKNGLESVAKNCQDLLGKGDFKSVINHAELVMGEKDSVLCDLAEALLFAGRYQDAAIRYRQALASNPQSTKLWFGLGKAEAELEHDESAIDALLKSLALGSQTQLEAFQLLFSLYSKRGEIEKLLPYMEGIEDSDTNASLLMLSARVLLHVGDAQGALSVIEKLYFNRYFSVDRVIPLLNNLIGLSRLEGVTNTLQQMHIENPKNVSVRRLQGRQALMMGNESLAEEIWRDVFLLHPFEPNTLVMWSRLLNAQGRAEEALRVCDSAINTQPEQAQYYLAKGLLLRGLKQTEEALLAYKNLVRLQPDNVAGYVAIADLFCEMKKPEQGLKSINVAVQSGVVNPQVFRAKGSCLIALLRIEEAKEEFGNGLDISRNMVGCWLGLVDACIMEGAHTEALRYLHKGLEYNPKHPQLLFRLGEQLLRRENKFEEAINCFNLVLEANPYHKVAKQRMNEAKSKL
ncbi:amino acid adenylation domain-containing protein [Shewanella waksmanii]|uniref:amino acid adenylation domain-containing protein n=1 Tax=Shewanella waksmanii TaxID=213783 RepID=UPI00373621E0